MRQKGGGLKRINEGHAAYAPLHYVLLFPRGELGWHRSIPLRGQSSGEGDQEGENAVESTKMVTQANYYAYHLFQRWDEAPTILQSGKLLQQYIVDGWAAAEQSRLNWVRLNQSRLHADLYHHVVDAFSDSDNITDPKDLGSRFILPATFQGSTRDMCESNKTLWPLAIAMVQQMPLRL